jgi:nickel-dependent lactate racemase
MIEPHSVSGFSGGRKSICPGIAAAETVAPCYSPKLSEHDNVRPGSLEDNPVHAEQMEIARKAGCDFIVNVILNQDRQISKIVGGHLNHAFLKGVSIAQKSLTDTVEKQVDIVVTSGGGNPFDRTWQQTIQGIMGALDILKPGGTIIIASACEEGVGCKEFEEFVAQFATIDDCMAAITSGEQSFPEQWQLVELAKALRKGKIKVVCSGIPTETLEKLFIVPCSSVEEAVADALAEYGERATIAVIPEGPSVLALAKHKEVEVKKPEPKKPEPPKAEVKKVEPKEPEPKEPTVEKTETKKATKKAVVKKTETKKAETKKATAKKAVKKASTK